MEYLDDFEDSESLVESEVGHDGLFELGVATIDPYGGVAVHVSESECDGEDVAVELEDTDAQVNVSTSSSSAALTDLGLFEAHWNLRKPEILFPWQTGMMGVIFGTNPIPFFRSTQSWFDQRQPIPIPERAKAIDPVVALAQSVAFSSRVARVRRLEVESESSFRTRAVTRWVNLLRMCAENCKLGRQLLEDVRVMKSDESLQRSVSDVLAPKSTRTLLKRGADLMNFVTWCDLNGTSAFPLYESVAYEYLCHHRDQGSAPTFPNSFRSVLNFAGGMFGLDGAVDAAESKRIAGLTFSAYITKAPRKRMLAFLVSMVLHFEHGITEYESLVDRAFSGFTAFMIHGRLRHSDAQKVKSLVIDESPGKGGYLEAEQRPGKTSTTQEKKALLTPVAASIQGVSTTVYWAKDYVNLLEELGVLQDGQVVKDSLLTTPLPDGSWSENPVCSTELTSWIRESLERAGFGYSTDRASHSCKATTLSWCAKMGIAGSSRKTLGYHVDKAEESLALYSRDFIAPALRDLDRVLLNIRRGTFVPDATRSGYFVSSASSAGLAQPTAKRKLNPPEPVSRKDAAPNDQEANTDSSSDSDDSSSSSSSSGSSAGGTLEFDEVFAGRFMEPIRKQPLEPGLCEVQHNISGTLHLCRRTDLEEDHNSRPERLKCGRVFSLNYSFVQPPLKFNWAKCAQCFGKGVVN